MKRFPKLNLKLVSATAVTIFSLFVLTLGAYAWFSAQLGTTIPADDFQVTMLGDCTLGSVEMYKFDYYKTIDGSGRETVDYLYPENGTVNKYDYSDTHGHFGYIEDGDWHNVSAMNIYDPVELMINSNSSLLDMNCNVIYKITFSSSLTTCTMELEAAIREGITAGRNQILLSDCVDFDIYFDSDLADDNQAFYNSTSGQYDAYDPGYKASYNDIEKTYYKISYLSSLVDEGDHKNFYSTNPQASRISLKNTNISMNNQGEFTVYINANYAPSELNKYSKKIYENNITARYNFGFEIILGAGNE